MSTVYNAKAVNYNITIEQGASFHLPIALQASGSVPMDLTGYLAKSQVRKTYTSPNALVEMNVSGSMDTTGTFSINLSPAQTLALPVTTGVWDLVIYNGTDTYRLLEGSAEITPDVTKV